MRILSIDGGGIRGLIPAIILDRIELQTGKRICDLVDLIAGTSTGGIIAAGVAGGIAMSELRTLYRRKGSVIFSKGFGKVVSSLGGLADEEYSAAGLEACLKELLGDRKLSEVAIDVLITSCDLAGQPVMFSRRRARRSPAYDFFLRDVARATSAAPSYFPPAEITAVGADLTLNLVDGGLAANQPAMCALADALRAKTPLDEISVVSIGTGFSPQPMSLSQARRCGLLNGARGIIRLALDGPGAATDYQCEASLEDRYYRLQPMLARPVAMDAVDADSMALLEDTAMRICDAREFEQVLMALAA
jgi:uncharacterized protein